MKNTLLTLALLFAVAVTGFGQTATTQTTLSAAITTTTSTNITVASNSGFLASTQSQEYDLFVDGELMKVISVSGTNIGVSRAIRGTRATAHATSSLVWFGIAGGLAPFTNQTIYPGSVCTATQYAYMPVINYRDGQVSACTGSRWNTWSFTGQLFPRVPYTGVNDAAYTVLLTDTIIGYTALSAARTVTLPAVTGLVGKVLIIRNESAIASNTIWIASTSNIDGVASGKGIYGTSTVAATGTSGGLAPNGAARFYATTLGWFTF